MIVIALLFASVAFLMECEIVTSFHTTEAAKATLKFRSKGLMAQSNVDAEKSFKILVLGGTGFVGREIGSLMTTYYRKQSRPDDI
jgi:hypothetical protein